MLTAIVTEGKRGRNYYSPERSEQARIADSKPKPLITGQAERQDAY